MKTIADITAIRTITLTNKFSTYDNRLSGAGIHANELLPKILQYNHKTWKNFDVTY